MAFLEWRLKTTGDRCLSNRGVAAALADLTLGSRGGLFSKALSAGCPLACLWLTAMGRESRNPSSKCSGFVAQNTQWPCQSPRETGFHTIAFTFRFKASDFQMFDVCFEPGDLVVGLYDLSAQGIALMAQGIALMAQGIALMALGVALMTQGVALMAQGVALMAQGVALDG